MAPRNFLIGIDPSGKHPPLIKHPLLPCSFSLRQTSISFFGVVAGIMVFKICVLQCLHIKVHEVPVMEIEGKLFLGVLKYAF